MDLIVGEHDVEEGGERRNQAGPQVINEDWTSVAVLSTEARDAGQTTVLPHSLKSAASAGRTLSMASWLSTNDRPTAGSMAGGGPAED